LQKKLGCFAREKGEMAFCFAKRLVNQKGLKMNNIIPTANLYDLIAEEYYLARKTKQGMGDLSLSFRFLVLPSTLKLLGNVAGKTILDVGCGPGLYASLMTQNGAVVHGMDISKEFIRIAKEESPATEFILGEAERLPYKNSEFDMVTAFTVLHYLNSWDQVLKEIHAILKKDGIFIFSHRHPFTAKAKWKKWFFKKFSEIEGYFDEGIYYTFKKHKNKKVPLVLYHKTYATIIKLLIKYGFEIIDYEDFKPLAKIKELSPSRYKSYLNCPPFCAWKVRKI